MKMLKLFVYYSRYLYQAKVLSDDGTLAENVTIHELPDNCS
jgi:hypothetical protein